MVSIKLGPLIKTVVCKSFGYGTELTSFDLWQWTDQNLLNEVHRNKWQLLNKGFGKDQPL